MKSIGKFIILIISICLSVFIMEIISRIMLADGYVPVFSDIDVFIYPELNQLQLNYEKNDTKKKVLLLGGSTLSGVVDSKELDNLDNGKQFHFYSLATTGHSSLDSYYKYNYLVENNYKFDYVVVYNSINDVRLNNIPPEFFSNNYSHNDFYNFINKYYQGNFLSKSLMKSTIGYRFYIMSLVMNWHFKENYVPLFVQGSFNPDWVSYGSEIKSAIPFVSNLKKICELANHQGSKCVIVKYAYNLPDNYSKELFLDNKLGYDYVEGESFPVEMWGDPKFVLKGLKVHNAMIDMYFDSDSVVSVDEINYDISDFSDICHFSVKGRNKFAQLILNFLNNTK